MRNRRRIQRTGPLVIYDQDQGLVKAFRNIPGVDTICINRLNLLKLAPGGHVGRFCIWTESAFRKIDSIYGESKRSKMKNTDLSALIKSNEIQSVLRAPQKSKHRTVIKRNPLRNNRALVQLNPFAAVEKRTAILGQQRRIKLKAELLAKKRGVPAKK